MDRAGEGELFLPGLGIAAFDGFECLEDADDSVGCFREGKLLCSRVSAGAEGAIGRRGIMEQNLRPRHILGPPLKGRYSCKRCQGEHMESGCGGSQILTHPGLSFSHRSGLNSSASSP